MYIIIAGIIIFVLLLLFPLYGAWIAYKKNQGQALYINQSNARDPRYFARSFSRLFEVKWKNYDKSGSIKLSKKETVLEADFVVKYAEYVDSIVVAENRNFQPAARDTYFQKEIFAYKDAYLFNIEQVRAIYCKQNMIIGEDTKILRWADAEGVLIIQGFSDLGISTSSATQLIIKNSCTFKRLYAPIIYFGDDVTRRLETVREKSSEYNRLIPSRKIKRDFRYVNEDCLNEDGIAEFSIVTKHELVVLENIVLQGNIRSHKGIRICDGAVVCGNLFAEEDIVIGENVLIFGTVFTQGNVVAEPGAVLGQENKISSVIARDHVKLSENTILYGYLSAENGGSITYARNIDRSIETSVIDELQFKLPYKEKLEYESADEFKNIISQGYRFHKEIKEVIIPDGVKVINKSMFYQCSNLEKVHLPVTIEEIGDFSFYNCESLREINIAECRNLKKIGRSAFESCTKINSLEFGEKVEEILPAAFSGCSAIKTVSFSKENKMTRLQSHVFKDCSNLEKIALPGNISEFGISAFYNCENLTEFNIPHNIENIGGYAFKNCIKLGNININEALTDEEGFKAGFPVDEVTVNGRRLDKNVAK
jgi:cytoskeletal protein CcmA (bactofilin family)